MQAVTVTVGPKLANLTFVILGDLKGRTTEKVIALIEAEGRVADKVAKGWIIWSSGDRNAATLMM